ncbi:MAG TPA: cyclopropane-fatty-acyl-phospholipid synthase family protein [Marmoricola sp.]
MRAQLAQLIFRHAIGRLPVTVELPDGCRLGRGGPVMVLHRPDDFFARLADDGLIGFGEAYMAGDFDSDELGAFLTELCRELPSLVPQWLQRLRRFYVARPPHGEANTVRQTRGNIARHYDLSNDMFATFLDESMSYSSALFADLARPEPLVVAQQRKIDRLLDVAGVGEGTRVLEIGTGWGELAVRAAGRGAVVHSVTLSSEQRALAQRRVANAGFSDRVRIELCDYRDIAPEPHGYDAIVSVEMIEAVGHEYWPTYFTALDALLAPDGKIALQAITMPHDRMLATRHTYTWINKYIFPGGFLPSTEAITSVVREHTGLEIQQRLSMGPHYARTLREWDARFAAAHDELAGLGFDHVFERMWHFYLCYSTAGFASGYLDVQQLQLARRSR